MIGDGENYSPVFGTELDSMETRHRGIAFDGLNFWVSGSNNFDLDGPNKLYQYSKEGELIATFDQPVPSEERSSIGFYGLTFEDDLLCGVDSGVLYKMELNGEEFVVVEEFEVGVNPARYLCYDPSRTWFIMGDAGSNIFVYNSDGTYRYQYDQNFGPHGLSFNPEEESNFKLVFISDGPGVGRTSFHKLNPGNGNYEFIRSVENLNGVSSVNGGVITNAWNPFIWTYVTVTDQDQRDGIQVHKIDEYLPYGDIENPNGTVFSGEEWTVNLILEPHNSFDLGEYRFYVDFATNACNENPQVVEVVMNLVGVEDISQTLQPLEWSFDGAYPNPFNPSTTMAFSLKETATVNLSIFNMLGQEVAELVAGEMQAGSHSLTFDGQNLASGIYFMQLNAGPIHEVRKLVLMK